MKDYIFIIIFIIIASVFCFTRSLNAKEEIEIFPEDIYMGDVFCVRINTGKNYKSVWAEFQTNRVYFNKCGKRCFYGIFPVELYMEPGTYTIQIKIGKLKFIKEINIKSKEFGIQNLTVSDDKVLLNKSALRRVKRENSLIKKVFKERTKSKWSGDFIYPLENEITTDFGVKRIINGNYESIHKGIDIKGDEGEAIMASNRGKVVLVKELFFGGKTVIIDHGESIYTFYMHLSKVLVKKNSMVSKGDVIGYVGSTGRSTGPHLHFGVKIDNKSVNPVSLVSLEL